MKSIKFIFITVLGIIALIGYGFYFNSKIFRIRPHIVKNNSRVERELQAM